MSTPLTPEERAEARQLAAVIEHRPYVELGSGKRRLLARALLESEGEVRMYEESAGMIVPKAQEQARRTALEDACRAECDMCDDIEKYPLNPYAGEFVHRFHGGMAKPVLWPCKARNIRKLLSPPSPETSPKP